MRTLASLNSPTGHMAECEQQQQHLSRAVLFGGSSVGPSARKGGGELWSGMLSPTIAACLRTLHVPHGPVFVCHAPQQRMAHLVCWGPGRSSGGGGQVIILAWLLSTPQAEMCIIRPSYLARPAWASVRVSCPSAAHGLVGSRPAVSQGGYKPWPPPEGPWRSRTAAAPPTKHLQFSTYRQNKCEQKRR